jgi:hypothetical protein
MKKRAVETKNIVACWACPSKVSPSHDISWRVTAHPLQWMLERQNGEEWHPKSFCVTREALLRCVREKARSITPEALERLQRLPDWHLDRQEGVYNA